MLQNKHSLSICLTGLLLLLQTSLFAQEEQVPNINLDPVTVTATVNPLQASKTGRNILVIKGEQFFGLPVHSVDELLRYVPGVEVQLRGNMGAQSDIVMRGGTFQQVLVILDGMRLNDPNTGHFSSYIPIAPAEIERIEVLKGASSAIYGSEAVGGVIHIITKSFAAKNGNQNKSFVIQAAAGEYDLYRANAGGFYQSGKTAIGGGILTNNTDGQPQRGTRGYMNNHTASLSASHFLNDKVQVGIRSAYDKRDFSAQNFYTTFGSDTATETVTSYWNQLQLNIYGKKDKISFDAGYKLVDDYFKFNPRSVANENQSRLIQALLMDVHRFNDQTILTTGLQYINKKIESNDRGNHNLDQAALFMILNKALGNFTLAPAFRVDYNERAGWEFVPQLNVSYQLNRWQFRGSIGKTIRDADFTERFNNYNKTVVNSGRIGNPDLEAERSVSYEVGADYLVNNELKIAATVFNRDHSKLIDWVPTPYASMPRKTNLVPTGNYALAQNISQVTTTGAELDLQYVKQLAGNLQLWSTLGLTWLNSESSNATPSFYISSHAKFLTNFNLQLNGKRAGITVNGIYKNRDAQKAAGINAEVKEDYFALNMRGNLFIRKYKSAFFVQVDNVFDHEGQDLLGSRLPGRWLSAGFEINFR